MKVKRIHNNECNNIYIQSVEWGKHTNVLGVNPMRRHRKIWNGPCDVALQLLLLRIILEDVSKVHGDLVVIEF